MSQRNDHLVQSLVSQERPRSQGSEENVFTPPLDIYETVNGLVLEADLPGVSGENLRVCVQGNVLEIYGKVNWPIPADARPLYEEMRLGSFFRSFILPEEVDADAITAEFQHGVLRLMLPKVSRAKPRRIEVKIAQAEPPSAS
ncbi:MAG: Hsp20/alpha crystallin family protein [Gemmatales bacterium]|nr:Hsp20/alpha crystallin family protein [Gemmatales bacterium]MCS7159415.1 Hsp20/alpha crystallin family protein [Gemmatales bacterium]MDW8174614.1 Hsp20/alpha crystallin family protein [Gemmatales bacterium]MDW8222747.1 Hsp20/alpha crystallin family protein [Gemmatales bacterium]